MGRGGSPDFYFDRVIRVHPRPVLCHRHAPVQAAPILKTVFASFCLY